MNFDKYRIKCGECEREKPLDELIHIYNKDTCIDCTVSKLVYAHDDIFKLSSPQLTIEMGKLNKLLSWCFG